MENHISRVDEAEERLSELENESWEVFQADKKKKKIENSNIQVLGVPGMEREKGIESLFSEIITENFPNLKKQMFK